MAEAKRPDPSDPTRIPAVSFTSVRRGWDPDEVRTFLTAVAAELQRAQQRIAELESADPPAVDLGSLPDDEVARLVGEETARVIATAREGATALRARAEATAAELLDEATIEANRVREAAAEEASRRRSEAAAAAAAEISEAKERGREMVAEANRHRDHVASALEQRRRAARDWAQEVEVEQRRLLEVFERARAVADDVVARLRPAPLPTDDADLRVDTRVAVENAIAAASDDTSMGDGSLSTVYDAAAEVDDDQPSSDSAQPESARDDKASDARDDSTESNVVHLFGVAEDGDDEAPVSGADTDDDGSEASSGQDASVGELFARLRDEIADADGGGTAGDTATDEPASADTDEAPSGPIADRDAALSSVLTQAIRKTKRVLADEQNAVLERLADGATVTDIGDLVPGLDEHAASYAAAVAPSFDKACTAAAALTGGSTPTPVSDASRWITNGLVEPLRDRLASSIVAADGDSAALTKRLRALYRDVKTNTVAVAVTDAVLGVHGEAVVASAPDGVALRWVSDPDVRACPDCEDNVLAGAQPAGTPFPTGSVCAPAHSGCRCAVVPDER